jgi:hypothetical protein
MNVDPLLVAIDRNYKGIVHTLLGHGADVQCRVNGSRLLLFSAFRLLDFLQLLID